MPLNWMDVSSLSFNTLLLLERVQLTWFPGGVSQSVSERQWAIALGANPAVEWYLRHKCPELNEWLDVVMAQRGGQVSEADVRSAEVAVLEAMVDLVVYAVDPAVYDAQPFLHWSSRELTALVDFTGSIVIDVGAGTGRLTLVAAATARAVFAVEPVSNLRHYLKTKARERGLGNVYPVDGLITDIPFPDGFADVTMGGHVFGDHPVDECREMQRVTRPGGMVILCPGNTDSDDTIHDYLVSQGFAWSRFHEPMDDAGQNGMKRKYWKRV